MKLNGVFFRSFLEIVTTTLLNEMIFKVISFGTYIDSAAARIVFFTLAMAFALSAFASLLPVKHGMRFTTLLCFLLSAYTVGQMNFSSFIGNYISLKMTGGGEAGRVTSEILPFLQSLSPLYLLCFASPVLFVFLNRIYRPEKDNNRTVPITALALAVGCNSLGVQTVSSSSLDTLYRNPKYFEKALKEFGAARFLLRDVLSISSEEVMAIQEEETETTKSIETAVPEETAETVVHHRTIDDTEWLAAYEAEEDEKIRTVDEYLMNRTVTDYNDYTGLLKDRNVIYIMVEALDYAAIDETLTPTLWKMKNEGWDFTSHYTPKYSCTTGESEFISEMSLIPESEVCTPNEYADNQWPMAVWSLFENAGYDTAAYHNWKDEFYARRTWYSNSGCQVYRNYDDLSYDTLWGWQSDLEMMELTVDDWIDSGHFFTLYVTSSMHFPYDQDSDLGNRYLDEINAVHPDYPLVLKRYLSKAMEFDKAMEYLLQRLEEAGKSEDTMILFFADHHPLNMDVNILYDHTADVDRREGLNEDRTPFVIYCPGLESQKIDTLNSTFDILPTVANLCDLNYDPRLYCGTDIFSDQEKVVYFTNGDWISEKGIYYLSSETFEPFGEMPDESYIASTQSRVSNLFTVSSLIFRNDYYADREFIADPVYTDSYDGN